MVNGDWLAIQFFLHAQMGLFQLKILTDHLSASYKLAYFCILLLHIWTWYALAYDLCSIIADLVGGRCAMNIRQTNWCVCFTQNFIYLCSNFTNWWTFTEQSWFCLQTQALPQFGIYSTVRVCSDCFNDSSR